MEARTVVCTCSSTPHTHISTPFTPDPVDDVERVDDVAEGLAHLAAMGVSHHGMEEDLLEGHLT